MAGSAESRAIGLPTDFERWRQAIEARLIARWFAPTQTQADLLGRCLLEPLSHLVARGAARRRARISHLGREDRPAVIVVGNLVVGGSGKTPLVIALASLLRDRGWRVGLLARGHRAERREARLVGSDDNATQHGDEPVLLARATGLPVACGLERAAALALLCAHHRDLDLIISDDGLQHVGLPRTLELAVFDERGAGNGLLIPAGPLREPLTHLASMDALLNRIAPGAEWTALATPGLAGVRMPAHQFQFRVRAHAFRPVVRGAGDEMTLAAFSALTRGRTVHALAAIARPERFFASLRMNGIDPATTLALSDHAPAQADQLPASADLIVMTAKDAVKFTGLADSRCWYLELRADIEPALIDWLEETLRGSPTH